MPELPEVEIVVRGLRQTVLGKTIAKVTLSAPPASIVVSPSFNGNRFDRIIENRRILEINRRGKNILISLSGNVTLWVHLKMTGHFLYTDKSEPVDKHDLVIFDFKKQNKSDSHHHLRFNDYRRFGRLRLFYSYEVLKQKGLVELGPEPLEITTEEFVQLCKNRNRMIKPALLDQSFIAGLGNIYTDESLYFSKIHPRCLTGSISKRKLIELHSHIQRLLKKSISLMGTTVDSYSGVNGKTGRFQKYLAVYNSEGEPCGICGTTIVREKIGSRSAHFCPRCQRSR
ncbi:MAG: DNA-formamidopyrimidine glycosylase [candidate division Zixibacteria bacterium]|nr:DNA-formamidopyrimidine glycosylase [candidate division Zixibacteria bacterium]